MPELPQSLFEQMGGATAVQRLVAAFYRRVQVHPELLPIFPADLAPVQAKQYLFLTQFFGGPPLYSEVHGHPMLRMRHMPIAITPARAQAWLSCMGEALAEAGIPDPPRAEIYARLRQTAANLVNS